MTALYLHWPFCKKKCPYCDFNSHVRDGVDHHAWRQALLAELRYWHGRSQATRIHSIFFGGGTPSLMEPATVAAVLEEAAALYTLSADCEITLEANPTSVEAAKFRDLRAAGVNRVSLGVQSFSPPSLHFLGREHSADEARTAIELAASIFDRYSFDLIYALPGQTPDMWELELRTALTYARGHLSLYQLTIEENTAFHHAYHTEHRFDLPAEPVAAELYERTNAVMEEAGMPPYEISNYAAPGHESAHNLTYWRGQAYLGIGPGAHGRVDTQHGRLATRNLKSPERWLSANAGDGCEEALLLTADETMEEKILMGLRLTHEGVNLRHFSAAERLAFDQRLADGRLQLLTEHGLVQPIGERLVATARGLLVLNRVIETLLR